MQFHILKFLLYKVWYFYPHHTITVDFQVSFGPFFNTMPLTPQYIWINKNASHFSYVEKMIILYNNIFLASSVLCCIVTIFLGVHFSLFSLKLCYSKKEKKCKYSHKTHTQIPLNPTEYFQYTDCYCKCKSQSWQCTNTIAKSDNYQSVMNKTGHLHHLYRILKSHFFFATWY